MSLETKDDFKTHFDGKLRQQTLAAKSTNELPSIMPRQSGFMSSVKLSTNPKPAKPVRRAAGRREHYGYIFRQNRNFRIIYPLDLKMDID